MKEEELLNVVGGINLISLAGILVNLIYIVKTIKKVVKR